MGFIVSYHSWYALAFLSRWNMTSFPFRLWPKLIFQPQNHTKQLLAYIQNLLQTLMIQVKITKLFLIVKMNYDKLSFLLWPKLIFRPLRRHHMKLLLVYIQDLLQTLMIQVQITKLFLIVKMKYEQRSFSPLTKVNLSTSEKTSYETATSVYSGPTENINDPGTNY